MKKIILDTNFESCYFIFDFNISSKDEYQKMKESLKSVEHYDDLRLM